MEFFWFYRNWIFLKRESLWARRRQKFEKRKSRTARFDPVTEAPRQNNRFDDL